MDWKLLKKLCSLNGVSGCEKNLYPIIVERLKNHGFEIKKDYIGNIFAYIPSKKTKSFRMAIDAHMDEVGMMASKIESGGFIRFITIGGIDPETLPGTPVVIYGKEEITGIIGSVPPHIKGKKSQSGLQAEDLFIDVGISEKDLEYLVKPGDFITFLPFWHENNNCVMSKALDNRVGLFVLLNLIETARYVSEETDWDIYLVFSSQEETGLKGAIPASNMLSPDVAIVLEGTVSNDVPGTSPHKTLARCYEGPEIRLSDSKFLANRELCDFIIEIAKKKNIKHQVIVKKAGGTNAAAYQTGGKKGSMAAVVSTPVRYIHSPANLAFKEDIKSAYDLTRQILLEINELSQLVSEFSKNL